MARWLDVSGRKGAKTVNPSQMMTIFLTHAKKKESAWGNIIFQQMAVSFVVLVHA
jgi:hypothetical protein